MTSGGRLVERIIDRFIESVLGPGLTNQVFGWALAVSGAGFLAYLVYGMIRELRERRQRLTQTGETEAATLWVLGVSFLIAIVFAGFVLYGGIALLSNPGQ
jgi:hypothetical protein